MKVPRSVRRVAAGVFVVLALAFFAYTLADAWNETDGRLPSVARLGGATLLVAIGLAAAVVAWVSLLETEHRLDHAASLLVSQLGKYVPGAIWQAAGLVSLSRSVGVRVSRSVTAFTVMALTQAVAGCTFAVLLAFTWSSVAILPRVFVGLGGVAALALLDRRWMVKLLHAVPRTRDASLDVVPSQMAIIRACLASVVTLAATSAAYVLLIGSFDAGKMDYKPVPLDLARFAGRLVDEVLSATDRRCPILLTLDEMSGSSHADERLLQHIFTNLLTNAVKYSECGETVHFEITSDGADAVCAIRDRGIGIPEADREWLFSAFHRGQNVGERAGSGLGLVIVKRCADAHGGRIHVDSTLGAGTTVTVRLPVFSKVPLEIRSLAPTTDPITSL